MEEEESSVQSLLERLQADLVVKFEELRLDNQSMKDRLRNIESKLGMETQGKDEEEKKEESQRVETIETSLKEVEEADRVLDTAGEVPAAVNDEELYINIKREPRNLRTPLSLRRKVTSEAGRTRTKVQVRRGN